MVGRDDGKYVLYPLYFDAKASRPPRRIAQGTAVHSPTADEVARAAQAVGLEPLIERSKHHPARWWKKEGRVLVNAVGSKDAMVRQVAQALKTLRAQLEAAGESGAKPAAKAAKTKGKGKASKGRRG